MRVEVVSSPWRTHRVQTQWRYLCVAQSTHSLRSLFITVARGDHTASVVHTRVLRLWNAIINVSVGVALGCSALHECKLTSSMALAITPTNVNARAIPMPQKNDYNTIATASSTSLRLATHTLRVKQTHLFHHLAKRLRRLWRCKRVLCILRRWLRDLLLFHQRVALRRRRLGLDTTSRVALLDLDGLGPADS
jgi:hypothetical protein